MHRFFWIDPVITEINPQFGRRNSGKFYITEVFVVCHQIALEICRSIVSRNQKCFSISTSNLYLPTWDAISCPLHQPVDAEVFPVVVSLHPKRLVPLKYRLPLTNKIEKKKTFRKKREVYAEKNRRIYLRT